jgi:hypothetical protein
MNARLADGKPVQTLHRARRQPHAFLRFAEAERQKFLRTKQRKGI